jgi:carboxyl-terminal processing protease
MPMSNPSKIVTYALVPLFTLLIGWQIGIQAQQQSVIDLQKQLENVYGGESQSGAMLTDPEREADITLMWTVWRILQARYIEPDAMNTQKMIDGAIGGLVAAIGDPYTMYMTPVQNTNFRDALSGHLEGIGAELSQEQGAITVVSPLKGSPAQRAGLLPKDVIVEVDGKDISGQNLNDVVSKIRGARGTKVTLTVVREGANDFLHFTIVRESITVPSTEYEVKKTGSGSVGYLAINQFGDETMNEVRTILKDVKPAELKGLIIDLRYNGGGYLDGAVDLVSMFVKEGRVVTVAGRDGESQGHFVSGETILPDIPLVILQNEASASASEITAGALQDNKRATIVGTVSFGKGTVQEVVELPGGSSLKVTIAHWLTPSGINLSKQGVKPDLEVETTREDFAAGRDPQLQTALEWLLDGEDISGQFKKAGTGSVTE